MTMPDERDSIPSAPDEKSLVEDYFPGGQAPEGVIADEFEEHSPYEHSNFDALDDETLEAAQPGLEFSQAIGSFVDQARAEGFTDEQIAGELRNYASDEDLEMALEALAISPEQWNAQLDEINERREIQDRFENEEAEDHAIGVIERMAEQAGANKAHAPIIAEEASARVDEAYESLVAQGMTPQEADEYLDRSGYAYNVIKELSEEARSAMISHRLLGGMPRQETLDALRRNNIK
jgi:hypothetical protein